MRVLRAARVLSCCIGALLLSSSAAIAYPYKVAITGDSIVESVQLRVDDPAQLDGLGARVRRELTKRGVAVGGAGFVPASTTWGAANTPWAYEGAWQAEGLWPVGPTTPFGPQGIDMQTASGEATAQITLRFDRATILFAKEPSGQSFDVAVDGGAPRTVSTDSATAGAGRTQLDAPLGNHRIVISNPAGSFRLQGIVASASKGKRRRVEVDQIGHSVAGSLDNLGPAQREAIAGMAPHLTLIMFGSNEELWEQTGQKGMRSRLRAGLMIRAKIARRSGRCVIIPHAPNPRSKSLQRSFQKTAQKAAADAHCIYAPLLDSIWPGASSQAAGLTYDGIHPTAKGYDLMARRLARFIASRL